jgi:hypothetical protein
MAEHNIQAMVMCDLVCLWVLGGKDGPVQHGGGGGSSGGGGGPGPALWMFALLMCIVFFIIAMAGAKL